MRHLYLRGSSYHAAPHQLGDRRVGILHGTPNPHSLHDVNVTA
jgi:hypothetical protein